MEQPADAVAENLRRYRESCGLSLDHLAKLTGVSKSMLRQVETGRSSPTIATIWKIANGLRISLSSLLSSRTIQAKVSSFRAESFLSAEGDGYRLFSLVPFSPQQPSEIRFLEMESGAFFKGEIHYGTVNANLFMMSGNLRVIVERDEYKVEGGEFCQFQADRSYTLECIGGEMATAILQLCDQQKI